MKVLIVGQWIYPLITPRANRTWELAKGFAKSGHDVTVYALLGDKDYSDEEKQYNIKIKNLGKSYFGLIDSQGHYKRNIVNAVMKRLVREENSFPGLEFYPMIRNCFERESNVDLLITIAYPHVIHWAASKYLKLLAPKCWIADCGDPFMGNVFYRPRKKYEKYERRWCDLVDYITVPVEDAVSGYYPEYRDKIRVIPQGFDNSEIIKAEYIPQTPPVFAFAGGTYKNLRDPRAFLKYLLDNRISCRFIVYSDSPEFNEYKDLLQGILDIKSRVPRKQLIYELSTCDFLINIGNGTTIQTPSKLIDYGVANRPILTISSDFTHDEQIKFMQFLNNDYSSSEIIDVTKFEIDNVVSQFCNLYHSLKADVLK